MKNMHKTLFITFSLILLVSCEKAKIWNVYIDPDDNWSGTISSGFSAGLVTTKSISGTNRTNFEYGSDNYISLSIKKLSSNYTTLMVRIYVLDPNIFPLNPGYSKQVAYEITNVYNGVITATATK